MEAAACERPVVTSRLPSYLGTFAERYFFMVEPENIIALADALAKVVNDDAATQRATLMAEARKVVEKNMTNPFISNSFCIYTGNLLKISVSIFFLRLLEI